MGLKLAGNETDQLDSVLVLGMLGAMPHFSHTAFDALFQHREKSDCYIFTGRYELGFLFVVCNACRGQ